MQHICGDRVRLVPGRMFNAGINLIPSVSYLNVKYLNLMFISDVLS